MEIITTAAALSRSIASDSSPRPSAKDSAALASPSASPLLSARLDQQVVSSARFTEQNLEVFKAQLDISTFTETEQLQVMILADELARRETNQLTFDPSNWEKHTGVLIAAIVAINISRQASSQLRGSFAVMAAEAAVAQGMAIVGAGKAAMQSAISGAAVAGAMALGGMALSLKGQGHKHADLKSNGLEQHASRNRVGDLEAQLQKNSSTLTPKERSALSEEIREHSKKAQEAGFKSALNEKVYGKNITVGQALSSMAMVLSTMVSSVVRLEESNQREREVLEQSEQMIGKSLTDEAAQHASEATTLLNKLLEVFQQINQSRNATANTIAGSVRA